MINTHPDTTIRPDLSGIGEPLSARAVLTDKKGLSTSLSESLGALALGVLVLTGLAVGVGAAYNYGQDSSAKQTLDAVKSAQVLNQARTGAFGDVLALTAGQDPALTKTTPSLAIVKTDKDYCAAVKSGSMYSPSYWLTAKSGKVLETKPTATEAGVTCPDPA